MKISIKYFLVIGLFGLGCMSGCDDFLDINEDPNNPGVESVPLELLLPGVQLDVAQSLGMQVGGLGQITSLYTHQIVRRGNLNDYGVTGNDGGITVPWDNLFSNVLTDVDLIIDEARSTQRWGYAGVGKLLKAYTYSIMVDVWGKVPYTERGQGAVNPFPNFEDGDVVYDSVFNLIDEAIVDLNRENPGVVLSDLIYGGNLGRWEKFGNTLKLKMLNQIRLIEDVSAEVAALLTEPLITSSDDDFQMQYGTSQSPDSRNPAYSQEYAEGAAFYNISPYFYEIMTGQNTFFPAEGNPLLGITDPRVPYYFYNQLEPGQAAENPTAYKDGEFVAIFAFSFNIDPNEGFDQSSSVTLSGLYPIGGGFDAGTGGIASFDVGSGEAPLRMLTFYDLLYIRAELALSNVTSEVSRDFFRQAMQESFAKVNEIAQSSSVPTISNGSRDSYMDAVLALYDAGTPEEQLNLIMTQKWIASFGFGVDSYTDFRRTGYPLMHDGNTDNLNVTVRTRGYAVSLPYNINDITLNPNADPQRRTAFDKVFWDN
jgi:hypothetical protein